MFVDTLHVGEVGSTTEKVEFVVGVSATGGGLAAGETAGATRRFLFAVVTSASMSVVDNAENK